MTEGNGNGRGRRPPNGSGGAGRQRIAYAALTQLAIRHTLRGIEQRKAAVFAEREARAGTRGFEVVDNVGELIGRFRLLAEARSFIDCQAEPERFAIRGIGPPRPQLQPAVRELLEAGELDDEISAEREFAARVMRFRS